jgi:predicted metalloprotease with PDZ domain
MRRTLVLLALAAGLTIVGFAKDHLTHFIGLEMRDTRDREGIIVQEAVPGGPAAKAGLMLGDVITSINGNSTIPDIKQLFAAVDNTPVGSTVDLGIIRGGKGYYAARITARVTIEGLTKEQTQAMRRQEKEAARAERQTAKAERRAAADAYWASPEGQREKARRQQQAVDNITRGVRSAVRRTQPVTVPDCHDEYMCTPVNGCRWVTLCR